MDSFDERFRKASEEFGDEMHYNKRVELFEKKYDLTPFTPAEILAQRRVERSIAPVPGGPTRRCPDCDKWMGPSKVCSSCIEGRKGNKTRWACLNRKCGTLIYSKRTIEEWTNIY